jgi:hypothetical protein
VLALPSQAAARDRLIVLGLTPGADVSAEVAAGFTEAVAIAAARPGFYEVISTRELQTVMGVQRQRQLLGCSQEAQCMTELGSVLEARYLLQGSIGRLGASYQLALQLVDTRKAETLNRATRLASSLEALRALLPYAVANATGLPPPPPPSRVPALVSLAGGAALLAGSGIVGGLAIFEDRALRREQDLATPGALATREFYAQAQQRLMLQRSGSLVAAGVGAGLLALGFMLWPPDVERDGLSLALAPSSIGLAGVLP